MRTNNSLCQKIIILPIFLLTLYQSHAQLVNIEEQRRNIKPGLQGLIDFSFSINQNTRYLVQFSNSTALQYTYHQHTLLILNDISILKLKDDQQNIDIINKNFQHIRYNYNFKKTQWLTYELFTQRQQNKIKYIKYRFLLGSGLRIRLVNNDKAKLFIAPLVMYENEILSDSLGTQTKTLKGDFYISASAKINDHVYFSHVTYYQPAIFNLSEQTNFEPIADFRLASETELSFEIIKDHVKFAVNLNLNYDSRPPSELANHPLFYTLSNKLTFKF